MDSDRGVSPSASSSPWVLTAVYRWASPKPSLQSRHLRRNHDHLDHIAHTHSFYRLLQATDSASDVLLVQLDYCLDNTLCLFSIYRGVSFRPGATFWTVYLPGGIDLCRSSFVSRLLSHCWLFSEDYRLSTAHAAYTVHVCFTRLWSSH